MQSRILYNDINLPEKVSDILELDFWILEHVSPLLVRTVTNPVKFSAFTSIFIHSGSCEADINLVTHSIKAPCIVNVACGDIVLPHNVSDDFDASFVVLSKRLTDAVAAAIKDVGIFSIMHSHPVMEIEESGVRHLNSLYSELKEVAGAKQYQYPFEDILFTIISYFY